MSETRWITIFTTLIIAFFPGSFKAAGEALGPYPTTNCYDDIPEVNVKLRQDVDGLDDCSEDYPDKDSFCFKICMLRKNDIIRTIETPPREDRGSGSEESDEDDLANNEKIESFSFTADDASIVAGLLVNYYGIGISDIEELEKDPKFDQVDDAMEIRAKNCEALSFVIPRQEYPCRLFTPETKEKMEKLKDCIEETLKC